MLILEVSVMALAARIVMIFERVGQAIKSEAVQDQPFLTYEADRVR